MKVNKFFRKKKKKPEKKSELDMMPIEYLNSTVNQKTYLYLAAFGGFLCLHRFWVDSYVDATIRLVLFLFFTLVADFILVPFVVFEILSLIEGFGAMYFEVDQFGRISSPPPNFWKVIQMTVRIYQRHW